jgi:hypothetical protein
MGISLRTGEPLEDQSPGPMWHPLWINRYYDLTRDPQYVPFILKYARGAHLKGDNTWTTALGALAYELSGDKSYLTQHFEKVTEFPRLFFHAPGDAYDWYGVGPGPIGDCWGAYICWGNLLYALQEAKITDVTPEKITRYGYVVGGKPSLTVYALEKKDQPITLTFKASSLGGDLAPCSVTFQSPSGKELVKFVVPPVGGPSMWTETKNLPTDGETGLYRFELNVAQASVTAPITDLPFEAMSLPKNAGLITTGVFGYLRPSDETKPVAITVTSYASDYSQPCNYKVSDAEGHVVAQGSLMYPRGTPAATFTLDPTRHKLPWKLDTIGHSTIQWKGEGEKLFLGPSDEAVKAIIAALKK